MTILADIHTTETMSGKMSFLKSINNGFGEGCHRRSKDPESPCFNCYSIKAMKRYPSAANRFQKNTDAMTNVLLPEAAIPRINASVVRFNAHGELSNALHARNLFRIAKRNPRTQFSLWTHDPKYVQEAIRHEGKPENLILIYSSQKLNKADRKPKNFDKVFTVYTKDFVKENQTEINCGKMKCWDCMKCYDPTDTTTHIKELLK